MDFRDLLDKIDKINSWQLLMEDDLSGEYWYIPGYDKQEQPTPTKQIPPREQEIEKTIQELISIYNELKSAVGNTKLNESILNESLGGLSGIVTAILLEYENIKALFEKDMPNDQRYTELSKIVGKLVANYGTFWVASTIGIALIGTVTTGSWIPILGGIITGLGASYALEEDTNKMVDQIIEHFTSEIKPGPTLAPNGDKDIGELQQAFIDEGYKGVTVNGLLDKPTITVIQQDLNKRGAKLAVTGIIDSETSIAIQKFYLDDTNIKESIIKLHNKLKLVENELLHEAKLPPQVIEYLKNAWNKFITTIKSPKVGEQPVKPSTKPIEPNIIPKIPIKQRIQDIFKRNPKLKKALIGAAVIGGGVAYKDELSSTIKKASDSISQIGSDPRAAVAQKMSQSQTEKPSTPEPTKSTLETPSISPEIRGLVSTADQALARAARYKDNRVRNAMERLDMFIDSIPGMRAIRKPAAWLN